MTGYWAFCQLMTLCAKVKQKTLLVSLFTNPQNKLYHKYNFYALYDDLFITCFDSDIRKCDELSEIKKWNWNMNNYFNINSSLKIEKIIIWGFEKVSHTHHYIHNMYYSFFKEYFNNLEILWFSNNEIETNYPIDYDNTLFFVSPTHGDYDKLPISNISLTPGSI